MAALSCRHNDTKENRLPWNPGIWKVVFEASTKDSVVHIPVYAEVSDNGTVSFLNAAERIELDSLVVKGDSFMVKMPYFNTVLRGRTHRADSVDGVWTDLTRENYTVRFTATPAAMPDTTTLNAFDKTFDVTFSPDSPEDMYKAVGLLKAKGDLITGTFLTESGDYRYLQGNLYPMGNGLKPFSMSCFDGTHLFFFTGAFKGDSVVEGHFFSGKHWSEPWEGRLDATAGLKDPDSLTVLVGDHSGFQFKVKNAQGDSVSFGPEQFRGKVTIVQIFGSWCPNCYDESVFVRDLLRNEGPEQLQIIPVAFERGENFEQHVKQVQRQFTEMGLPYLPYFGGSSGKEDAGKAFPMLNRVMSYPTMIILDKKGVVRKIHTGFYGPGTGAYYTRNTSRLKAFIEELLAE
jgi:thiol-disulfide isomerase/thioredoxin